MLSGNIKRPKLMNMLHEITQLHFKDLRRSLYGSGNYRLSKEFKRYHISPENWNVLTEDKKEAIFVHFLKNTKKARYLQEEKKEIRSTLCDFSVPNVKLAKKPGQKKRSKSSKTTVPYWK